MIKPADKEIKEILETTEIEFALAEDSKSHAVYTMIKGDEFNILISKLSDLVQKKQKKAFKAGFGRSGEGWNGEYMPSTSDREEEIKVMFEEYLLQIKGETDDRTIK